MTRTPKEVFAEIAALTAPKCASCRVPHTCCTPEQCADTMDFAKTFFGVTLAPTDHPRLPLMGSKGCTAAPHHRPICAVHVCEQHFEADPAFAEAYFNLREEAGESLSSIISEAEKGQTDFQTEVTGRSYAMTVSEEDFLLILKDDRIESAALLWGNLNAIPEIHSIEYSGHFGAYIHYSVNADDESEAVHEKVRQALRGTIRTLKENP